GGALRDNHLLPLPSKLLMKSGRSLLLEAQSFSQNLLFGLALPETGLICFLLRRPGSQLIHATRMFLLGKAALVSLLLEKAHLLLFGQAALVLDLLEPAHPLQLRQPLLMLLR